MNTEINLNRTRSMDILLVEDNEADVILTREAFKESKLAINMDRWTTAKNAWPICANTAPIATRLHPT